jgi:ABC-type uncharacterized transport system YnjBCD ATPase subunit
MIAENMSMSICENHDSMTPLNLPEPGQLRYGILFAAISLFRDFYVNQNARFLLDVRLKSSSTRNLLNRLSNLHTLLLKTSLDSFDTCLFASPSVYYVDNPAFPVGGSVPC